MEDQENVMDFKSIKAMFQEKENFLKNKPALPEKPKVVPPPQSPTHLPTVVLPPQSPTHLPAGAQPSLLTSINQALESKTLNAPRVVFRDEKERKKLQINSKSKEKPDKKVKEGKDKAGKEGKEKVPEDSSDPREKKENANNKKLPALVTQKDSTAGTMPVSLPPKTTTQKKRGFSPFKKGTKRESADDTRLVDSGPAPLISLAYDDENLPMEPLYSIPKARPLNKMTLPDPSGVVAMTPPSHNREPPNSSPPPTIIPDIPVLRVPTPQSETPAEVENPALPLSSPASHIEIVSNPTSVAPAPPSNVTPNLPTITAPAPPSTAASNPPTITAHAPPSNVTPKRPTITAPAPPSNVTPKRPTITAPAPPSNVTPKRPTITAPAPPSNVTPKRPTITAPAPPSTAAPNLPTFTAPAPLSAASPNLPTFTAPAPPSTAAPNLPTFTAPAPNPPSTAAPNLPTFTAPNPPSTAAPNLPTFTAPNPPSTAAPNLPTFTAPAPNPPSTAAPNLPTFTAPAPLSAASPKPPKTTAPNPPTITAPPSIAVPTPTLTNSPKPPSKLALSEPSLVVSAQSQTQSRSPSPFPTATPSPSPSPSPPEHHITAESDTEDVNIALLEKPPSSATKSPSTPQLAKPERPISALSVLERAGDMSSGKKTPPGDQRIFSALEKARKKANSPLLTPNQSFSVTPPPEELFLQENPTSSIPELPPVDYEGGKPASLKPAQLNGTDFEGETSSIWEILSREESAAQEMMAVPSPQSKPDLKFLDLDPDKPDRNLDEFVPPPFFDAVIPVPPEFSEAETAEVPEFEESLVLEDYSHVISVSEEANKESNDADVSNGQNPSGINDGIHDPETEVQSEPASEDDYEESPQPPSLPVSQDPPPKEEPEVDYRSSYYEESQNTYESIAMTPSKKKGKLNGGKKSKGAVKNPYTDSTQTQETSREKIKSGRFGKSEKKTGTEVLDEKELKKKEKQRLEKEKKELKVKLEREKKEQKEKEKKENEMKKKFKITGQEEAMYQAKVTVTTKRGKHNLPVKCGDVISIIRTTNCPKGKWLAKDNSNNTYGYVSVKEVELDVQEMLKLGKQAGRNSATMEAEDNGTGNRLSNHFHHSAESFTDDSDEWTCDDDDDDPFSPAPEASDQFFGGHARTFSMPDMGDGGLSINHQHSYSDMCKSSQTQDKSKAIQKLATFLQATKPVDPTPSDVEPETSPVPEQEEAISEPEDDSPQEAAFDPGAIILPPPDMYADTTMY